MTQQQATPDKFTQQSGHSAAISWTSPSLKIYLTLVAIMVVLGIMQTSLPLAVNQGQQMSWISIVLAVVLGWVGLVLSPRAGFPDLWDSTVSSKQRFWTPFMVGAGLGVTMVLFDLFRPLGTDIQTRFPDSLIVFGLAGLVEEIIIHLFLTTFLVWLISTVILRKRHQETVFWIVAVGIGILYWLLQISAINTYFPEKFSIVLAVQILLIITTTITIGAFYFRKSGFLAAISLRYGFYLVWHILWAGGIGLVAYFM